MPSPAPRPRRPARAARWVASGLTATVAVGSVAAMADAEADEATFDEGTVFGAVARSRGAATAAALMGAADAGEFADEADSAPIRPPPPILGGAGVS